ncbi:MAG: twin-arginine translocase TatA/TatE family subunit [Actinomycetota bacterium]|nr:twin-arginine translocase TatA/TatE family subunit [Actinomycetota bacterium]
MGIGPFEILIVLAILGLIIGPRRVTNMAKSLGRGIQDFVAEIGDNKPGGSERPAIGGGDEEAEGKSNDPPKGTGER